MVKARPNVDLLAATTRARTLPILLTAAALVAGCESESAKQLHREVCMRDAEVVVLDNVLWQKYREERKKERPLKNVWQSSLHFGPYVPATVSLRAVNVWGNNDVYRDDSIIYSLDDMRPLAILVNWSRVIYHGDSSNRVHCYNLLDIDYMSRVRFYAG